MTCHVVCAGMPKCLLTLGMHAQWFQYLVCSLAIAISKNYATRVRETYRYIEVMFQSPHGLHPQGKITELSNLEEYTMKNKSNGGDLGM